MDRSGIVLAIVIICCLSAALSMVIEEDKLRSVIGIDLGTSSYCVAVYMNGHVEIIPNDEGNRTTPSFVAFTDSETLIGEAAKNQAAVNAQRTIFDVRRLIGREFEDKEVQSLMKLVPYKIVNKDGMPYIQVEIKDGETKVFSPEEISTMILTKIKETAEASLGKKITDAVVPVPSYFSDEQRQATEDAGLIAGFNVVTVIGETMAAAYAYGLHEEKTAEKTILVFNLGDGTFDVTILQIETGDSIFYLARTHLGGEDLNQRIMDYLIKLIKNKYGKDVSKDSTGALVNLRMEAERAIRALSSQHQVRVNLFDDLSEPLTFEELNKDLLMELMNKVMEDAPLEKHQIDGIILVGGNTNIPKVQQFLRDYFNGRVEPKTSVNPDEAVAIGAVVAGDLLIKDAGRSSMC